MCSGCDDRDALIAELERALEGAVWVTGHEVSVIQKNLGLSPTQARMVLMMHKAGDAFVQAFDLMNALPRGEISGQIAEAPNAKMAGVLTHKIRRKLGVGFIENKPWAGYRLSRRARSTVTAALNQRLAA